MDECCLQIAKLQESQAQLLDHCSAMDSACHQLQQELDQMRSRYESGKAENVRLKTEVEHLRKNLRVGELRDVVSSCSYTFPLDSLIQTKVCSKQRLEFVCMAPCVKGTAFRDEANAQCMLFRHFSSWGCDLMRK